MRKESWIQGINDYSDLTFEEFAGIRLMAPQNCSATHHLRIAEKARNDAIPDSYDWVSSGVVTAVKNQGSCGSCWTFSTVGAMESHWNILGKGKNLTFSEQQLVDCAHAFNNHGCNGGLPSQAFEYIRSIPSGLESDKTYPYTGKDGKCVYRPNNGIAYAKYGSYNITQGSETELAERLYSVGPMAISFEVISGFQNYKSGVYTTTKCGKTSKDINHAVLATGYGNDAGHKFWNVKNSWGPSWGEKGFFRIEKDVNMCAIAECNSYPLIDKPASDYVEVTIESK